MRGEPVSGLTGGCRWRHQAMASSGEMETQRSAGHSLQSLFNANPLPSYDSFWMASEMLKLVRCKS